jgi:hypothetical protein
MHNTPKQKHVWMQRPVSVPQAFVENIGVFEKHIPKRHPSCKKSIGFDGKIRASGVAVNLRTHGIHKNLSCPHAKKTSLHWWNIDFKSVGCTDVACIL